MLWLWSHSIFLDLSKNQSPDLHLISHMTLLCNLSIYLGNHPLKLSRFICSNLGFLMLSDHSFGGSLWCMPFDLYMALLSRFVLLLFLLVTSKIRSCLLLQPMFGLGMMSLMLIVLLFRIDSGKMMVCWLAMGTLCLFYGLFLWCRSEECHRRMCLKGSRSKLDAFCIELATESVYDQSSPISRKDICSGQLLLYLCRWLQGLAEDDPQLKSPVLLLLSWGACIRAQWLG